MTIMWGSMPYIQNVFVLFIFPQKQSIFSKCNNTLWCFGTCLSPHSLESWGKIYSLVLLYITFPFSAEICKPISSNNK